ncbi:hypothetical protein [Nesterenkonia populi]|uniref:hypothetical protein n=1 Tax=Nesterenkonia populi TaxID=1591087 RepID=UPI0011BF8F1A|nr:hypothetical protein [Nesterenkonia populi]
MSIDPFVPKGFVDGVVVVASADKTADEDRYPDKSAPAGRIHFVPVGSQRIFERDGRSVMVLCETVSVGFNAEGFIVDADAEADDTEIPGVFLVTGRWTVRAELNSGLTFSDITIEVTEDHTTANPLNFVTQASLPSLPGVRDVVRESDRLRAEEAAETSEESASEAGSYAAEASQSLSAAQDAAGEAAQSAADAGDSAQGAAASASQASEASESAQDSASQAQSLVEAAGFLLDQRGEVSGDLDLSGLEKNAYVHLTLTSDVTVDLPSAPIPGRIITLVISQDSDGEHALTVPDALSAYGVLPLPAQGGNAVSEWHLVFDGVDWKVRVSGADDMTPVEWSV